MTKEHTLSLPVSFAGCPRPHLQLTALRQLRILYLHNIIVPTLEGQPPPPEVWEPVRACTALAFLSISGNGLRELPPAVADMAHLQVGSTCWARCGQGACMGCAAEEPASV